MDERERKELEEGLARLDQKINALNAARDSLRAKLNAAASTEPVVMGGEGDEKVNAGMPGTTDEIGILET